MKKISLTGWILVAMLAGILVGLIIHFTASEHWAESFSSRISIVTDIFLRLIKMIIAPLVFSTLVVGIAKLGDIKSLGRIGGKTLGWFIGASFISLLLGLLIMNITNLGLHLQLPNPESNGSASLEESRLSFRNFITHVFPKSLI